MRWNLSRTWITRLKIEIKTEMIITIFSDVHMIGLIIVGYSCHESNWSVINYTFCIKDTPNYIKTKIIISYQQIQGFSEKSNDSGLINNFCIIIVSVEWSVRLKSCWLLEFFCIWDFGKTISHIDIESLILRSYFHSKWMMN